MSFSDDNNLEIPTSGVADWDSPLNGNFVSLGRGFEFKATAGSEVSTGDAISLMSSGFVMPYEASSLGMPRPVGIARTAVGSGDAGQFMMGGVVRSMELWSGHITNGEPVYVDPASAGFLVNCYSAAEFPVGWAVDVNAVMVNPFTRGSEKVTQVVSFDLIVGSAHAFVLEVGHRGYVRDFNIISASVDAYKIQFHSGSLRVQSEELYESITTSVDGGAGDFDISSLNFLDKSIWNFENTDTASPGLVFGLLTVQSASSVGSGTASLTFTAERM